jgi:sugar phosphate isomerase/epimerase
MTIRQGFTVEGDADATESFAFAAEHGFEFVELNMENGFQRACVNVDRICALAAEHDLDLVVHLPYGVDAASPHEHAREGARRELAAAMETAAAMDADKGVFHAHSFAKPGAWDRDRVRELIFESVRTVSAAAPDGFEACAENLKGPFVDAGDFSTLFGQTEATVCLDTGHAHATGHGGAWQAALLREHGDRISHLHLNDTRREGNDEHLPVGIGQVDFEAIARALRETDWSGTCTHELYSFGHEYAAHGKTAFDRLLDTSG